MAKGLKLKVSRFLGLNPTAVEGTVKILFGRGRDGGKKAIPNKVRHFQRNLENCHRKIKLSQRKIVCLI